MLGQFDLIRVTAFDRLAFRSERNGPDKIVVILSEL